MQRRSFLKIIVATAASAAAGAACGDDGSPSPGGDAGTDTGTDTGIDAGADTGIDTGLDGGADTGGDAGMDTGDDADAGGETLLDGAALFTLSVASGDPRPDSVILWTRTAVGGDADAELELQVARDEAFTDRLTLDGAMGLAVTAEAAFDHCVKVRVEGLESSTHYWYRFVQRTDDGAFVSPVGRTKTAPAADADTPVRFAFVSCQDFNGVYYNPYKRLVEQDIDVLIHLGDYIYETTADPSFQTSTPDRAITFTDTDGAITFGAGTDEEYQAARSLSNYRELYQLYRGDAWLRRAHELFPMIATWDDHEFTDDCYGAVGTYYDGREDELDVERRKNANQAWFEYMPVDYGAGPSGQDFAYDREAEFPGDLVIYRDLRFGQHAHFVMTDLRTWRPDHPIAEDELPGAVPITAEWLEAQGIEAPGFAEPYLTEAQVTDGGWGDALQAWAADEGVDPAKLVGPMTVAFLNDVAEAYPDVAPDPIGEEDTADLAVGVSIRATGKTGPFSQLGSRYLAADEAYDLVALKRYQDSEGASENAMGDAQRAWFLERMQGTDATWKIWGNEFCLFSKRVDVRAFPTLPESFKNRYYLSVEDWGGLIRERDALIDELAGVGGVVAITGDIHAFFASSPYANGDTSKRITEFVTGAISSGTYERLLVQTANSDPGLREAGAAALALLVPDLMVDPDLASNPDLAYASIDHHGFAVVTAGAERFEVEFHRFDQNLASQDMTPAEARGDAVDVQRFRVEAGSPDVWMERDGTWQRWDVDTLAWV